MSSLHSEGYRPAMVAKFEDLTFILDTLIGELGALGTLVPDPATENAEDMLNAAWESGPGGSGGDIFTLAQSFARAIDAALDERSKLDDFEYEELGNGDKKLLSKMGAPGWGKASSPGGDDGAPPPDDSGITRNAFGGWTLTSSTTTPGNFNVAFDGKRAPTLKESIAAEQKRLRWNFEMIQKFGPIKIYDPNLTGGLTGLPPIVDPQNP